MSDFNGTVVTVDDDDDDDTNGVMIALLPITSDWCKIAIPHMTLVFAGDVKDLKPTDYNELAKDASALSMLSGSLYLRVTGVQEMGPDDDRVDVLMIQPSAALWAMRRAVEDWDDSEFPFNPHCTIGPPGSAAQIEVPYALAFDKIAVQWGTDSIIFQLQRS